MGAFLTALKGGWSTSPTPKRKVHGYANLNTNRVPRLRFRTPIVFLAVLVVMLYATSPDIHTTSSPAALSTTESRRVKREIPFQPSGDPRPIQYLERFMDYANYPLSIHRPPPTQFTLSPAARFDRPVVALIMATNNPRAVIRETAQSLFGQSLQNFVWVIVDDHTTAPESLALLEELAKDPRVVVLRNPGEKGLAQGRNVALKYLLEQDHVPAYFVSLDDDDMFEFTALEKTTWMLESNTDWDLAGFPYIKFGATNETVNTGVHSGWDNFFYGNFVPNAAVYRSSAVIKSGCRYDEVNFHQGGEDWDFWMCLAAAGSWGGSIPEALYWYRMNPAVYRSSRWGSTFIDGFDDLKKKVHAKRPQFVAQSTFPTKVPRQSYPLEPISWAAPYESNLAHHDKTIMIVLSRLASADLSGLRMIQLLAEQGYRVTVLCTLYQFPAGIELKPAALQWTHDVHVMPSFLRAHDFPRYIKHLLDSRGIGNVVISDSQLLYEILPALVEQVPHVKFIDYLRRDTYDSWKSGGYAAYSTLSQRFLARTVASSESLKGRLVARGHDALRVGVVKLGIDLEVSSPATEGARAAAKRALFDIEPATLVVVVPAEHQGRPLLVPLIVKELVALVRDQKFLVVLLGGLLEPAVRERIEKYSLETVIRALDTPAPPQDYLVASDIFLLPSACEGLSIAAAEAMAMAIPVIAADAGALPEQLGEETNRRGGILIQHTFDDEKDSKRYANEISKLFRDPKERQRVGASGRHNVEESFDWRKTLARLPSEVTRATNFVGHGLNPTYGLPNPAASLAIQSILVEAWGEVDMKASYGWYW